MKYGLPKTTIEQIRGVFARFPEIDQAILYGSRAKGTYHAGSDIDLTLYGDALTPNLRDKIVDALDDLLLPYTIDLSLFDELDHAKLREHIERVGVVFYERAKPVADVRGGWETKTLNETCLFLNGLWKGDTPPLINVGVIRNTNFTKDGMLDDSDIAYLDVETKKFEKRSLQFGDLILEKSGGGPKQPVGRIALFEKKEGNYSFSNFTSAIRVKNADELHYRFLHRYLHWIYLSGLTKGMQSHSTGIRNLDVNAYKAITISFPSISEQKRIVSILDEAFAGIATAIANAKKNLVNAREVFESTLQSVFSINSLDWQARRLGEVCQIKPPKSEARKKLCESDMVSFVPMEKLGISQMFFDVSQERPLNEVAGSYTYFMDGDVLLSKITPCFENGKLGIARNLKNGVGFGSSEYIVFRCTELLNNKYLYYFLSRSSFREDGASRMTGAVGHKRVPNEFIENTCILVPDIHEQQHIVNKLDEISAETIRLESIYQQKLTALDQLKKSILNQAFSGQLH